MQTKTNYINLILITIVFFPFWIGLEKDYLNIFFIILSIFFIPVIIFLISENFCKKKNFKRLHVLIIAFVIFYGIDINFGLWLLFDKLLTERIFNYFISLIFIISSVLLIYNMVKKDILRNKIFFLLIIFGLFSYNIAKLSFEFLKVQTNFEFEDNSENKNIELVERKKLIIFLDEMIGPGGVNQNLTLGQRALESYTDTFEKNGFKLYKNTYSIFPNTVESIPHALNFKYKSANLTNELTSENFFDTSSKWYIKKNKFFDQNSNIIANKSLGINFCRHKNVSKCINLKSKKFSENFIRGFQVSKKDFIFDKILKSNSIILRYLWRIFYHFDFFVNKSDFSFQKAYFEENLNIISEIVSKTNYKIYFFHLVVPHRPMGFQITDRKICSFDENRTKITSAEDDELNKIYINEYYQDVICTNIFIQKFFKKLKDKNVYNNLDILITSDAGIVISSKEKVFDYLSAYSVLFAIKWQKNILDKKNNSYSMQYLFSKYLDKNFNKKDINVNIFYDGHKRDFFKVEELKSFSKF